MPRPKRIRTHIAWSEVDHIMVKGRDLCSGILGELPPGDIAFLMLKTRWRR